MNRWFDELGEGLAAAASRRGVRIDPPTLDPAVAAELLELARVAAHTQERRFAPLASFLAGVTAERVRAGGGDASGHSLAELVREVRQGLEAEAAPPSA